MPGMHRPSKKIKQVYFPLPVWIQAQKSVIRRDQRIARIDICPVKDGDCLENTVAGIKRPVEKSIRAKIK